MTIASQTIGTTMHERLKVSRDHDVLRVRLDSPQANAIDLEMARELRDVVPEIASAAVVLLEAAGPNFSVGGDVGSFAAAEDRKLFLQELVETMNVFCHALASTRSPVVAATTGWAVGAGLSFLLLADVVVAGEGARFGAGYGGIGLTPDGGMSATLIDRVGRSMAMDLLLTGRRLDAREALSCGLVARVVPDAEVDEESFRLARSIAAGPLTALRSTKELVRTAERADIETQLQREADAIAARVASPEGREGVDAFLAERAPEFRSAASQTLDE